MKMFKIHKSNILLMGLVFLGVVCLLNHVFTEHKIVEGYESHDKKTDPKAADKRMTAAALKVSSAAVKQNSAMVDIPSNMDAVEKVYEFLNLAMLSGIVLEDAPKKIQALPLLQQYQLRQAIDDVYSYYNNGKPPPNYSGGRSPLSMSSGSSSSSSFGSSSFGFGSGSKKSSDSDSDSYKKSDSDSYKRSDSDSYKKKHSSSKSKKSSSWF